jgi:hypothetical protein
VPLFRAALAADAPILELVALAFGDGVMAEAGMAQASAQDCAEVGPGAAVK